MRTYYKVSALAESASRPLRALAKRNALAFAPSMTTVTTPPGFVDITLDGQPVRVPADTTVFDAARINGINIPTLCHLQSQTPVGVCRLCVVDTGARVLAASCVRPVEAGMKVATNSEKVLAARKTLLELMMSDHPSPCARQQNSGDCELETLSKAAGVSQPRFAKRFVIRGCDEVKSNFVLGRMGKGYSAGIAFDLNSPMGDSTCISCGECMVSCPTGALTNKSVVGSSIAAPSSSAASAKAKSSAAKANSVPRPSTFSKAKPKSPSPLPSRTSRRRAVQKDFLSG